MYGKGKGGSIHLDLPAKMPIHYMPWTLLSFGIMTERARYCLYLRRDRGADDYNGDGRKRLPPGRRT